MVHLPLVDATKSGKVFRTGAIIGSYEKLTPESDNKIHVVIEVHNCLLPQNDQAIQQGSQAQRLAELVETQNWGHLTPTQREDLRTTTLQHEPLFSLEKNELGLMSSPLVNIKAEDPQLSHVHMYQYPEQAKDIISSMLSDMED